MWQKIGQSTKISINQNALEDMIEEISDLLDCLIQKKLEIQMSALIEDNNKILEEIKLNVEHRSKKMI